MDDIWNKLPEDVWGLAFTWLDPLSLMALEQVETVMKSYLHSNSKMR